jgi:hypothetical protein
MRCAQSPAGKPVCRRGEVGKDDAALRSRRNGLCSAAAVIRLAGVAALGLDDPSEQLVVVRGMSVAHLGIVA